MSSFIDSTTTTTDKISVNVQSGAFSEEGNSRKSRELSTKLNLMQLVLMAALVVFLTFREAGKIISESISFIKGHLSPQ